MDKFFNLATNPHNYHMFRVGKLCAGISFGLNYKFTFYPYTFFDRIKNLKISRVFIHWGRESYFNERVIILDKEVTKWYKI